MEYSMRSAVHEEMVRTLQHVPGSLQELLFYAAQEEKVASLTPFYGYYLYPREWLHYSLQNEDPLVAELNEAMLIALNAPTLTADPKMNHFFFIAASSNKDEKMKQSISVAFRTTMIFQTYMRLQNKLPFGENDEHLKVYK